MEAATKRDQTCGAFLNLEDPLDPAVLHRFVLGQDDDPKPIAAEEIASTLSDPFAQLLLSKGSFPSTSGEVVDSMKAAVPEGDPLKIERAFIVGEGSQLPLDAVPFERRTMRFLVALGKQPDVDVIVSTSSPSSRSVEVMAWDRAASGFNYYRTVPSGAWVFAGNSIDALREQTEGRGPFESHTSGNVIMKELRFPWVHWHASFAAPVDPQIFAGEAEIEGHRWTREKDDGDGTLHDANICEEEIVIPSIARWTSARFDALKAGSEPPRPHRILEQVLTSPTVNLVSSQTESAAARQGRAIDLPRSFFADSESLPSLGLTAPPALSVPPDAYVSVIEEFRVRLEDGADFEQLGDTHFAFAVPERALEDIAVVKATDGFLLSRRMIACLLMVDFPNPVFSKARASLLARVPAEVDLAAGPERYSETLAEAILAAAETADEGSGELQFKPLWEAGEGWPERSNELLGAYYKKLQERLASDPAATFRDWFRLAEANRRHAADVKKMPIFEFPLLLARSDADEESLSMRPDATVGPS